MDSSCFRVRLANIYKYIGEKVRCLNEGEAILEGRHIICCGVLEKTDDECRILALCLQTTDTNGKPHEITVTVNKDEDFTVVCTCKAGNSRQCKHCIGTLLYINRTTVEELEDFSCTDTEQVWSKMKKTANFYQAVRVQHLCHVQVRTPKEELSIVQHDDILKLILKGASADSALAKHMAGRQTAGKRSINAPVLNDVAVSSDVKTLFRNACECNVIVASVAQVHPGDSIAAENLQFYEKFVRKQQDDCEKICESSLDQQNELWKSERKLRITGSVCYELFTYGQRNPDWDRKITALLCNQFKGNRNTELGKKWEPVAREIYAATYNRNVKKFGLVISPIAPWLAYSPDGVVFHNNVPSMLVEIKTVVKGEEMTIAEMLLTKTLPGYLIVKGENIELKKRHKHYGQIQLGMALLNLKSCDFIMFASSDKSIEVINVQADKDFGDRLLQKVSNVYFEHVLPKLNKR